MKNPWLSLWMSGANAWMGAARGVTAGIAAAEAKRTRTALTNEAIRQMSAFWFPAAPQMKPVYSKRRTARRTRG